MPSSHAYHDVSVRRLGLAALLVACLACVPARAGEHGPEGNVVYWKSRDFNIPIVYNQLDSRIRHVNLHVSYDLGLTYTQVASQTPRAGAAFNFRARSDGWYWFVLQMQYTNSQVYPANPRLVIPGLKVLVDTTPPDIRIRPAVPIEGTVGVEWTIKDENLDPATLTLDYRAHGSRDWIPLHVRPLVEGQYSWAPTGGAAYEVRLRVADLAGNIGQGITFVTPTSGAAGAGQGAAGPAAPFATTSARRKIVHVRSKTFQLKYKLDEQSVGRSGVKHVTIWWTTDPSRAWGVYHPEAPHGHSVTIAVREPGLYGFTLVPRSGVGLAARDPQPGDEPQVWVQVDVSAPVVNLLQAYTDTGGPEIGKLVVRWTATDAHMRHNPITILYSATPHGTWTPLASNLENTGIYTGKPPDLREAFLRVEAVDEAGNVGHSQTAETVKFDPKTPKVDTVTVEVQPVEPGPGPGASPGAAPAPGAGLPPAPQPAAPGPPGMPASPGIPR